MQLVVGLLLGAKVKQVARHLDVLQGYDEWQEVKQNRRNSRAVLAQSFLTLSRLAGDQEIHIAGSLHMHWFDLCQARRETELLFFLLYSMLPHRAASRTVPSGLQSNNDGSSMRKTVCSTSQRRSGHTVPSRFWNTRGGIEKLVG